MRFYRRTKKIIRRTSGSAQFTGARQWVLAVALPCLCLLLMCAGNAGAVSKGYPHDLLSVAFPSEQNGWACGRWGTLLHTADGGKTWTAQASGTIDMLTSISFANDKTGWAVGDRGTILHTSDGGGKWVRQKSPADILLMSVQFVSPLKGWAVGEKTTILHTENGGATWTVQFKDGDFILRSVSFCDEQNGWACGEYGHIYRTGDGGVTWKKQAGRYSLSTETGEIEADDYLFQVRALGPRTALAVGIDSTVMYTNDGGSTWKKTGLALPKTHLFALTHGAGKVVIGGTGLLAWGPESPGKTVAAKADPPLTYGWVGGVCPRGKTGFAAVGKRGWIYLSDDSGASWRRADIR